MKNTARKTLAGTDSSVSSRESHFKARCGFELIVENDPDSVHSVPAPQLFFRCHFGALIMTGCAIPGTAPPDRRCRF